MCGDSLLGTKPFQTHPAPCPCGLKAIGRTFALSVMVPQSAPALVWVVSEVSYGKWSTELT